MSNGGDPRLRHIAELLIGAQASISAALRMFGELQAQSAPEQPKRNEPPTRFGQKKIKKDDDGGATQARVSAADAAPPDQE